MSEKGAEPPGLTVISGGDGPPVISLYKLHLNDKCVHYAGRVVDDVRHVVTCQACGEALDPFRCLLEMAREYQRTNETLERLKDEVRKTQAQLDDLLRLEANARARLARLLAKEGVAP